MWQPTASKNLAWNHLITASSVKLEGDPPPPPPPPNQIIQWSLGEQSDRRLAEGLLCLKAHLVILPSDIIWANERCTPLCKHSTLCYSDYNNAALNVEDSKDFEGDHSKCIWKLPIAYKTKIFFWVIFKKRRKAVRYLLPLPATW